jgi:unsaturated chondroitin disaccharide hydrolase
MMPNIFSTSGLRKTLFLLIVLYPAGISSQTHSKQQFVAQRMELIQKQYASMLELLMDSVKTPRTSKNSQLYCVPSNDWTSGFFAGSLWYIYDYTIDLKWLAPAKHWTEILENEKNNTHTHDLGFMLYCSYGNGYRLTHIPEYKNILIQGAKSLSTRFHKNAGCIQSWDAHGSWKCPVIIDNMMNLEFLFWATRATGDSSFYQIAISHANTTLQNHFRTDNSSYHVVDYDTLTGKVLSKKTAQGAVDESAWARGQSWGLYGYTMMYRETRNTIYLEQAQKIAEYILKRLPPDGIPYWDYDAPNIPDEPKDASAAAITSSALFELSNYADEKHATQYRNIAEKILLQLSSPEYLAEPGENNFFILKHSVGHKPAQSEIDVPLIYADYYYIEALTRYAQCK